jgi:6-phosphogluconolactonase
MAEVEVGAPEALAERFAALFEEVVRAAVAARGRAALALPGGSVARAFFPRLVRVTVPWPSLHVFFVDERAVPLESPESNEGLARRLWLDHVPVPPAQVHALHRPGRGLDESARDAERALVALLGAPPRLDLALLGVGADGHVASLFPGRPELRDARFVLAVRAAPKPPAERLTLGPAALAAARQLAIAAFGAEKADAVAEALRAPASALPVAQLVRAGPRVRFLLDPAAAARATGPAPARG